MSESRKTVASGNKSRNKNRKTINKRLNKSRKKYSAHIGKAISTNKISANASKESKAYKKLQCSPNPEKNNFSCFDNDDLFRLRDRWNMRHPDVEIKTNDPKEIWTALKNYLSNVCNKESCWLKQNFVTDKDSKDMIDSFAPISPKEWEKNPNEWLSSVDILQVMKQYEKAYKCFEFLGPSPIDYNARVLYGECVFEEICNFNLADQIKVGKTKVGLIFNTDTHDNPGKHWISLFINIKKGTIYFFDSAGDKIPANINKFVKNVKKQGLELNKPINFTFDQNYPVEHQYGNTECGIYSLYFVVHMLEDKLTANYLKTHKISDEYVNKFRKIYFNREL
jgi:hypothetical protein